MSRAPRPNRREAAALVALGLAGIGAPAAAAPDGKLLLRRGVSAWPWFALTREYPAPRTDYAWPPFEPDRAVPTRRDLATLRDLGLDFIRIPVDPGPFISFTGARRRQLLDEVMGAVAMAHEAGLNVVVDVHPNEATHLYASRFLTDRGAGGGFAAYLDLLHALAGRLVRLDPARVALELMNEPPQACISADWPGSQRDMLAAVRSIAPSLWSVVTGACGGTVPGLEALAPLDDGRVIYTFHLYEPYVFTHQGAPWLAAGEPIYRYLNAVPWPADRGSRMATKDAVRRRLDADATTPRAEKDRVAADLDRVLDEYFDARPDRWFIDGFVDRARRWAERNAVPPERLLLGEFGALRSDERYVASRAEDRARYIRDMRMSAEAAGLPWCYWNMFDGFGLFAGDADRRPDPLVVAALGLRGRAD